jgi:hypothetical protein
MTLGLTGLFGGVAKGSTLLEFSQVFWRHPLVPEMVNVSSLDQVEVSSVVPEPLTLTLMAVGVVAFGITILRH